ncbi:MAG: rRNA pseudouridine synthase [Frankiales bacterium]|nr:rRNA pseudouridine synthase [Frankiales bacterium]
MSRPPVEPPTERAPEDQERGLRLQRVLAQAGLGSRRSCEELIAAGRVTVNGARATLGRRVVPGADLVRVDGELVPTATDLVHLALHKPVDVVTAMTADGRRCVGDLVADLAPGLHHVGRLDADSEGLLLLTNDGPLSHRLTHPSWEVPKRYLVELDGVLPRSLGRTMRAGVELEDGPARVDSWALVDAAAGRSLVEVVIHEGRNRIVRRMFEATGHPVRRLVRTAIGPIRLGELKPGRHRRLSSAEVRALYAAVDL